MADYWEGKKQTLKVGGLRFAVQQRSTGDDGGSSIEVYGDVEGRWLQVLRFDCFKKMPHYHAPASNDVRQKLGPSVVGDGLEWTLDQIRSHLPEMLTAAGFVELAGSVNQTALSKGWVRVKEAVEASAIVAGREGLRRRRTWPPIG